MDTEQCEQTNTAPGIWPSEALYGFVGWLTSREEAVTLGAVHDAAIGADLVNEYCIVNNLAEPREGIYPDNLKMPKDGNPL